MKNQIRSISLVALFLLALTTIGAAQANYTASVQNNSTQALGTVTVYQTYGPQVYVNVPGPGTFDVPVTSDITVVVINGFGTPQGGTSVVKLANGKSVKVTVSGGNIVVQDQQIIQ